MSKIKIIEIENIESIAKSARVMQGKGVTGELYSKYVKAIRRSHTQTVVMLSVAGYFVVRKIGKVIKDRRQEKRMI